MADVVSDLFGLDPTFVFHARIPRGGDAVYALRHLRYEGKHYLEGKIFLMENVVDRDHLTAAGVVKTVHESAHPVPYPDTG